MASVFLSYDRDDTARARHFAQRFEKAGHHVWWDLHVRGGSQFSKVIEEALKAADVVVVLWSKDSIESPWVRDEAASGRDSSRLIPVTIDGTQPPLGFRQFQTIDLSRWKGRGTPAELQVLLADVAATAPSQATGEAQSDGASTAAPASLPKRPALTRGAIMAIAGLFVVLVIAGIAYRLLKRERPVPTVAVAAADASALSQSLAQNVSVDLGSVAGNSATNFRLLESGSGEPANLRISVSGRSDNGKVHSTVALVSSAEKAVLWSKQLEQTVAQRSNMEEAIAVSAMAAVACAADGSTARSAGLGADELRSFINGCVSVEEGDDPEPLVAVFRRTTAAAPRFARGWGELLRAEIDLLNQRINLAKPVGTLPSVIRRDVATARQVDPALPELTVAEVEVQPATAFYRSIATIDAAKAASPNNVVLLDERTRLLSKVGRLSDAIEDAQRAVELKPYSPKLRTDLIFALASADLVERAWSELAKAKQLWPDVPVVAQADYFLNLRFGDFEKTWRSSGAANDGGIIGYFKILRDPSDANINAWTRLIDTHQMQRPHRIFILQALGPLDRVDQLYDYLDQWPIDQDLQDITYILFRPYMAKVRRNPRFMRLSQRLGLLDYWEKSGEWPDFCTEPDMPYDCKKEAAKLHA